MTSAFCPTPTSGDPRGDLLVVTPRGEGCDVTVSFSPAPGHPETDALLARLDDRTISFSYGIKTFPAAMYATQLARAVAHLHAAYGGLFAREGPAFWRDGAIDRDRLRGALKPLAELGFDVYTKLFHLNAENEDYTSDALPRADFARYSAALRRHLETAPALHVVSPRHLVPWTILHPSGTFTDPLLFWGFGKTLQILHAGLADEVFIDPAWRAIAGLDDGLGAARRLHDDPHPLARLRARVDYTACPRTLFERFADADILYHFGHASGSSRGFEFAEIVLNGATVTSSTLETMLSTSAAKVPDRRPLLVFLNGCSTGAGSAIDETIPGILVKYGRRRFCFVMTIGAVPPWPAAELARRFFAAYLGADGARERLGPSLRRARLSMLEELGSPIGLLYVAFGKLATTIQTDVAPRPSSGGIAAGNPGGRP